MVRLFFLVCLYCGSLMLPHSAFSQGNLMIVGGGLEADNQEIFDEILRLSGGAEKAVISVIPAASGVAAQTFAYFSKGLIRHGAKAENIHLIPIAMEDDDSTLDVNEASWLNNGNDELLANLVRKSNCVWFSGGDQLRIIKTLHLPDGSRTAVLDAVWDVFEKGGLIGGTSAGAAIMSDPMIGNGSSLEALMYGAETSPPGEELPGHQGVLLTKGLGFFPHGLVDQHFHARSRTGRLLVAMAYTAQPMAYGIDENTALVYYGKEDRMKVAGAAAVTIFDASHAKIESSETLSSIENLKIHYLESGDSYNFNTGLIVPSAEKILLSGNEEYEESYPFPGGMFAPAPTFQRLITKYLMNNKTNQSVSSLNFTEKDIAYQITLSKTDDSQAFILNRENSSPSYTLVSVNLSLSKMHIELKKLNN